MSKAVEEGRWERTIETESGHNVWHLLLNQLMAGYTCGCLVTPFRPALCTPLLHVVTSVPLLQLIRATCAFHVLCAFTLLLNNSACLCCYVVYRCVCGHLGKRQLPVLNCKHTHTQLWLVSALWLSWHISCILQHLLAPFWAIDFASTVWRYVAEG